LYMISQYGFNWTLISNTLGVRTPIQCHIRYIFIILIIIFIMIKFYIDSFLFSCLKWNLRYHELVVTPTSKKITLLIENVLKWFHSTLIHLFLTYRYLEILFQIPRVGQGRANETPPEDPMEHSCNAPTDSVNTF